MDALRQGGGLPTILNAANEVAVEAFLDGRVAFGEIPKIVEFVCERALRGGVAREPASIEDALAVDHIARQMSAAYWR